MDKFKVKEIKVGPRTRTEPFEVDDLKESIGRVGLIHPIVIDRQGNLIAGGRRLEACKQIGLKEVEVKFFDDLDDTTKKIIELEENVKRKDLHWKDQVCGVKALHELFGQERSKTNTYYTAERIGIHHAHVSKCIAVATALEKGDEQVAAAEGSTSAWNILCRKMQRSVDNELSRMDEAEAEVAADLGVAPEKPSPKSAEKDILQENFIDFAKKWKGRKFNFIHCDFPYGINQQKSEQGRMEQRGSYDDRPEVYWALVDCLFGNLDKFLLKSGHLFFWFSMTYYAETIRRIDELVPDLKVQPFPCVWHKSDGKGIIPAPQYYGRRTYETALFMTRGDRPVVEPVAISYAAPTASDPTHPSQKPEPVLRHFFRMIVDENTEIFDPTCGSGTAIVAAEDMGAARGLGLDVDQEHVESARFKVSTARRMRLI